MQRTSPAATGKAEEDGSEALVTFTFVKASVEVKADWVATATEKQSLSGARVLNASKSSLSMEEMSEVDGKSSEDDDDDDGEDNDNGVEA